MWSQYDFQEIEALHQDAAEDYTDSDHPNGEEARTLLTAAHNLHDTHLFIEKTQGKAVGDEHRLQLFYLRRGIREIFSMYWLCKHHCYSASYGRIRFLWELYLVIREFNR